MTLACGSATVAIMATLYHLGTIQKREPVTIQMLGGTLHCVVSDQEAVELTGSAQLVFNGQS